MLKFDLFGAVLFVIALVTGIVKVKAKKDTVFNTVVKLIFILYLLLLIKMVFFPIPLTNEAVEVMKGQGLGSIRNFIPFKMIIRFIKYSSFSYALKQVGGNIILLFPLGIFIAWFYKETEKKKIFLIGLGTTVFIELTQGLIGLLIGFQYRVVDVDDIILNTLGYVIGVVVGEKIIVPVVMKYLNRNNI